MFSIKQSAFLGLFAATMVWIWEFFLHYSPQVLVINDSFESLWAVAPDFLKLGHILILIWIPFYFIWYYHLYLMLEWSNEKLRKLFFFLGSLAFMAGWIWIASRGFMWQLVHIQDSFSLESYNFIKEQYLFYFDSLLQILRYIILLLSILWIYLIWWGKTKYPKSMILVTPIFLLLWVFATTLVPSIGKYLAPIAMNVVHFIIFSASIYILYHPKKIWKKTT